MPRKLDAASLIFGTALGAIALGTVAIISTKRHRGGTRLPSTQKPIGSLFAVGGDNSALFEPRTGSFIAIRDAREKGANRAASAKEVSLFLERRRKTIAHLLSDSSGPAPGGLGAGISFGTPLLHFNDYTAVYFYDVAPPSIGPQPNAQLLYMTSSNTASKGCEALLSFFADEQYDCVFRIWDWAHPDVPGGGKFVKSYTYTELADYLIPYRVALSSGKELDSVCVYIVNLTRRLDANSFQNEVYLHNHSSGTRDLMWSYAFEWPTKMTDGPFFWGPIFETFPDPGAQYALGAPLGFDQTLVVQDGIQYQLTDRNSSMTIPVGNGLSEIYRSQTSNSGLICSVSQGSQLEFLPTHRTSLNRPSTFMTHPRR
jgi:hypothetical protein